MKQLASTLDSKSGMIVMGTGKTGARLLNFAPLLRLNNIPFVDIVSDILKVCEESEGAPVEIEFAMTFHNDKPNRLGFLQVRPMVVSNEEVEVNFEDYEKSDIICSSPRVLGNGKVDNISDIIYLKSNKFDAQLTAKIAVEIEELNKKLLSENRSYLLVGFGRWGTSDAWAGIPVDWSQISGASVIVEAPLEGMNSELSQGSHFFHNVTGFGVKYFSIPYSGEFPVNWDWLNEQAAEVETDLIRQISLSEPISVKVDGKSGRGIILNSKQ